MKQKLIIATLLIICIGCNSRINSGRNWITGIHNSTWQREPWCVYDVQNDYELPNTAFVDSCNKHKIKDTVYIYTK